ncbi:hypothetical protein C8Q79DRAFT_1014449 [Trametes meyenii]|nr:hypothetical protein C8Q79DRAFT_1014449 [Trametes meyenii]
MLALRIIVSAALTSLLTVSAVPSTLHLNLDIELAGNAAEAINDVNTLVQVEDEYYPSDQAFQQLPLWGSRNDETTWTARKFQAPYPGCTPNQVTHIENAIPTAQEYVKDALRSLADVRTPARYQGWFGPYDKFRAGEVKACYAKVLNNDFTRWTYNCHSCAGADEDAYVNPAVPRVIQLCPKFFQQPVTGGHSMASILVREGTRFAATCNTEDEPSAPKECSALAQQHPDEAIKVAGSYEFFASNYPLSR